MCECTCRPHHNAGTVRDAHKHAHYAAQKLCPALTGYLPSLLIWPQTFHIIGIITEFLPWDAVAASWMLTAAIPIPMPNLRIAHAYLKRIALDRTAEK